MKKLKSILEASRFEMTPDKKKKELARMRQEFSAYKSANVGLQNRLDRFEKDAESILNKLMSGKAVGRSEIDKLDDHISYVAKMAKILVDDMESVLDGVEDIADTL